MGSAIFSHSWRPGPIAARAGKSLRNNNLSKCLSKYLAYLVFLATSTMADPSGFHTSLHCLCTIAVVIFGHIALVFALPVDGHKDNIQLSGDANSKPDHPFAIGWPSPLSAPFGIRVQFSWLDEGVKLDETDVYLATLHCAGVVARSAPGELEEPRYVCSRPMHDSVKILVDVSSSTQPRGGIVFGITAAAECMARSNRFKKLKTRVYDTGRLIGTITFVQGSETMRSEYSVNPFKGVESHALTFAKTSAGSIAEANISIADRTPSAPQPLSGAETPRQDLSDDNDKYYLRVESTQETGLTLQAYTMAAVVYFQEVVHLGVYPQDNTINDHLVYFPWQEPPKPGFDVTVNAGYIDIAPRTRAPYYTMYALALAMVEVPMIILEGGAKFDFFNCKIFAYTGPQIPLGYLWAQKGLPPDGSGDRRLSYKPASSTDLTTFR